MVSTSLRLWQDDAQAVFAELELAHRATDGHLVSRQITYAYVTALAAQFQLYCRAVHTETAQAVLSEIPNAVVARMLEAALIDGRRLERGNANAANLGSDFGRFDLNLWQAVESHRREHGRLKGELTALIEWRNAIGHGDVTRKRAENKLIPDDVDLNVCRNWSNTLTELVITIDEVLASHCEDLGLSRPR